MFVVRGGVDNEEILGEREESDSEVLKQDLLVVPSGLCSTWLVASSGVVGPRLCNE